MTEKNCIIIIKSTILHIAYSKKTTTKDNTICNVMLLYTNIFFKDSAFKFLCNNIFTVWQISLIKQKLPHPPFLLETTLTDVTVCLTRGHESMLHVFRDAVRVSAGGVRFGTAASAGRGSGHRLLAGAHGALRPPEWCLLVSGRDASCVRSARLRSALAVAVLLPFHR